MATLTNTPATPATTSKDFKIVNIDIQFKGKRVPLGGLFVNDKSSKVLKQVFAALEDGRLQPEDLSVFVKDTFNSKDTVDEELSADDFA